jgi:hypothetical protein
MEILKVSDITAQDCAEYIRLVDADANDIKTLSTLLNVAKVYVGEYTGRSIQELDDYKDIIIAVLILVQDMWDNRTLYVDTNNANKVVESILGMHSVNLL